MQVRGGGQSVAVQITASHAAEVIRNGSKSGKLRTHYDYIGYHSARVRRLDFQWGAEVVFLKFYILRRKLNLY